MDKTVLARVAALPRMSLAELKKLWRDLYGEDPPRTKSTYLVRRLAYRIQELSYGVDPMIEERIAAKAKELFNAPGRQKTRKASYAEPIAGTRLLREYKGIEYQVMILADGYEYQGARYKSLSKIAALITGAAWSGPAFFGLKQRKDPKY
jgi:hypothetical protein